MAQLVFDKRREFAERLVIFRDKEERVVAETATATDIVDDPAPAVA